MADISKCEGHDRFGACPKRDHCYRYTAPVNKPWQSYLVGCPIHEGICEYYWPTRDELSDQGGSP